MDNLTAAPWSARHFRHQSHTVEMCVTGHQVLPSPSVTAFPGESVVQPRRITASRRSTTGDPHRTLDIDVWHLETDRRLSVDHSKLVLVPVGHSEYIADDRLCSACSCHQPRCRFQDGVDRKRCPRCTRAPTVDELRLDDERRGRYKTLFLGAEFISPVKTSDNRISPIAESTKISRSHRSCIGTTWPVAEGSRRGVRSSVRSSTRSSPQRDKVVRADVENDATGSNGDRARDECDECGRLVMERYGSFERFFELVKSREIPADRSWLPDHDCATRRRLDELTRATGSRDGRFGGVNEGTSRSHQVADLSQNVVGGVAGNETESLGKANSKLAENDERGRSEKMSTTDEAKFVRNDNEKMVSNLQKRHLVVQDVKNAPANRANFKQPGDVNGGVGTSDAARRSDCDVEKSPAVSSTNILADEGLLSSNDGTVGADESLKQRRTAIAAQPTEHQRGSSVDAEADGKSSSVVSGRAPKPKRQRDSSSATKRVAGRLKVELEDGIDEQAKGMKELSDDDTMEENEAPEDVEQLVFAEPPPLPEMPASLPTRSDKMSSLSVVMSDRRQQRLNSIVDLSSISRPQKHQQQEKRSITVSQFGFYSFPPLCDERSRTRESDSIQPSADTTGRTTEVHATHQCALLTIGSFELPADIAQLKDMLPADYLRHHCRIATGERDVYRLIYKRHCNRLTSKLHAQELHRALRDVIPADVTPADVIRLCSVAGVQPISGVDDELFVGLVALATRMVQSASNNLTGANLSSKSSSRKPPPSVGRLNVSTYDEALHRSPSNIERVDMSALHRKLDGIDLNPAMSRLIEIIVKPK